MARTPLIIGNWKMYKTGPEAHRYVQELAPMLAEGVIDVERRVFLAVPFTAIGEAVKAAAGSRIVIGAQNMHDCIEGAFTGEISAPMLKASGAQFVLLGHSERRQYFHETNAFIQRKVQRALMEEITPILCVGETLAEREQNRTERVLHQQLEECLNGLNEHSVAKAIIAYEPLWAIGTGKTATPEIAQGAHRVIRSFVAHHFGSQAAHGLCILYGGSVRPDNIAELMREADIDGALVGGASLDVAHFIDIINY